MMKGRLLPKAAAAHEFMNPKTNRQCGPIGTERRLQAVLAGFRDLPQAAAKRKPISDCLPSPAFAGIAGQRPILGCPFEKC
jgi:hypothetical protein